VNDTATPDAGTAAPAVLDVDGLCFSYKGQRALAGLSFAVHERSIHGFVGPNGAGKTTTLKILATLLKPQQGGARVFGHDLRTAYKRVRSRIGFMPDQLSMYRQMTVFEYLDFFAAAYGLGFSARNRTIKDVLALTDMEGRRDSLIQGLSRGMQQRVGLARVLVHDPALLLLDEPASGLDPRARIELMEILRELRRMGKTIFISSHILSELADLCDSFTIIDRGVAKYSGPARDLLARDPGQAVFGLVLDAPRAGIEETLGAVEGVSAVQPPAEGDEEARYLVTFRRDALDTNRLLQAAMEAGARVLAFEEERKHLNQAFMDLTEPGVPT
jgi:ABC-2 type transport system ATP-binding protein